MATTEWLPAAFAPGRPATGPEAASARQALALLSGLLVECHHDKWLTDMLRSKPSPTLAAALQALASSIIRNNQGDPSNGQREARRAEGLFKLAGSEPGELRARLVEVYALHLSLRGDQCLQAARGLGSAFEVRGYAWDRAQLELEQAICTAMVGNIGAAKQGAKRATALSEAAHYKTLRLRCLGIAASFETDSGNAVTGWSLDRAGLALYWAGSYPPLRAQQFYSDLITPAEETGRWNLATALAQQEIAVIRVTPYRSLEAMARSHLAVIANLAGRTSLAEAEYERASRLFAELPPTGATRSYAAYCGLGIADLEAQHGALDRSLARLAALKPALSQVADYFVPIRYYRILATLDLRRGRYDEAEKAFRAVVAIAETGLRSLGNDRGRREWDRETRGAYQGLVEIKLRRDRDPQTALDLWRWYRSAESRAPAPGATARPSQDRGLDIDFKALDAGPALPRIGTVRSMLPSLRSRTVLSYAELEDGLAIWAFDDRGIEEKFVPLAPGTLEQKALAFARECSDPSSDLARLRADGAQLYRWLIAPVEDRLAPGRALVIEPDGAVSRIPLQALRDPSGRYLGARWAIMVSPSPYREVQSSIPKLFTSQTALVIGAPAVPGELAAEFAPLPDAEREARMVAARFQRATLLTGRAATLEAAETGLAKAEVFHFAGHAFAGGPLSGLLLAPSAGDSSAGPEVLDATRLSRGEMPQCKLAVLSTCPTLTQESSLEVPQSLAEEFLRAGVRRVVASRWSVDSAATKALMDAFYSGLLAGVPIPQALQAAEAAIRQHPETGHPYYWASFSAFGGS